MVKIVTKKYSVYMDGEILERNLTREDADALIEACIETDNDDEEEHYYMVKPTI